MKKLTSILALFIGFGSGYIVSPIQAFENQLTVSRVIDGDTLVVPLNGGFDLDVRLKDIDAPEKTQAFGDKSKAELERLCLGKSIEIIGRKKSFGRTVGQVTCDGINVNSHMVKYGYAWVFDKYNQNPSLYKLQDEARLGCRGIWSNPGAIPPWEYRNKKQHEGGTAVKASYNSNCPIVTASN